MNESGLYLAAIMISLAAVKWVWTWIAGRRYMKAQREKNGKDGISALINRWKKENITKVS